MRAAHDFDAITGMIKFTVDGIAPEFDVRLGWENNFSTLNSASLKITERDWPDVLTTNRARRKKALSIEVLQIVCNYFALGMEPHERADLVG